MFVLFDTSVSRTNLYPLSLTRPLGRLRHGIFTLQEKWEARLGQPVHLLTEAFLQEEIPAAESYTCIDATLLPDADCLQQIAALLPGQVLEDELGLLAYCTPHTPQYNQFPLWADACFALSTQARIHHPAVLFQTNEKEIVNDFQFITKNNKSAEADSSNTIIGKENLFIAPGASMQACIVNAAAGPVYIGKNALVMEGSVLRGPIAIGEGSVIKMGAKLYSGTTIGPWCVAGGEIKNSILTAYSNKAHEGYLGDSVIGEWCNIGAGTSNSNVKNTGSTVKMWNETQKDFLPVGLKGGLIMGDYSRCAINTSLNTGTTVGVSANLFEGAYPEKLVPSFSWGRQQHYLLSSALQHAANWKKMKNQAFSSKEELILRQIYTQMFGEEDAKRWI